MRDGAGDRASDTPCGLRNKQRLRDWESMMRKKEQRESKDEWREISRCGVVLPYTEVTKNGHQAPVWLSVLITDGDSLSVSEVRRTEACPGGFMAAHPHPHPASLLTATIHHNNL
ncbi:hypothetical protein E2C01_017153 [Portunus trituberculatus]|uniref:Uncharacterized protein n=1 Tax=Portunus trituberculatus TaxID=210409 RepID=A0A5B7DQU5_PORTR|nr:hypothetical protein [Portunus trituberculatus]